MCVDGVTNRKSEVMIGDVGSLCDAFSRFQVQQSFTKDIVKRKESELF